MDLPEKLPGLYHAGSVGIIMSGWLGTINYGVIVANRIDKALFALKRRTSSEAGAAVGRPPDFPMLLATFSMSSPTVTDLIPHRPPFLFVDDDREPRRRRPRREAHLARRGGFLQGPLSRRARSRPGVLLCEAVFQTAALLHGAARPAPPAPRRAKACRSSPRSATCASAVPSIRATRPSHRGEAARMRSAASPCHERPHQESRRHARAERGFRRGVEDARGGRNHLIAHVAISSSLSGQDFSRPRRRQPEERGVVRREDAGGAGRARRLQRALGSPEANRWRTQLAGQAHVFLCDVEKDPAKSSDWPPKSPPRGYAPLHGIVHSIAFANYSEGFKPFHETKRADFLAGDGRIGILARGDRQRAFKPHLARDASVVTIGISSLLVTPDNYGYMGPIKAALESSVRFLAKSFSADTAVRFNAVGAGPLKTSASAGIPGYIESYLYAEKLTFRKKKPRDAGSGRCGAVSAQPAQQRHQRHDARRRRRPRLKLLRSGTRPARDAAGRKCMTATRDPQTDAKTGPNVRRRAVAVQHVDLSGSPSRLWQALAISTNR